MKLKMNSKKKRSEVLTLFIKLLSDNSSKITVRHMFGYDQFFQNKIAFAILSEGIIYFRKNINFYSASHICFKYEKPTLKNRFVSIRYYSKNSGYSEKEMIEQANLSISQHITELKAAGFNSQSKNILKLSPEKTIRIKDLPNLQLKHERIMKSVGVHNIKEMKNKGALSIVSELAKNDKKEIYSLTTLKKLLLDIHGAIIGVFPSSIPAAHIESLYEKLNQKLSYMDTK